MTTINISSGSLTQIDEKILEDEYIDKLYCSYNQIRELYPVLTFKMGDNTVYVNRDTNAVLNFEKIVESLIYNKCRPVNYCRQTKPENIKPLNIPKIEKQKQVKSNSEPLSISF